MNIHLCSHEFCRPFSFDGAPGGHRCEWCGEPGALLDQLELDPKLRQLTILRVTHRIEAQYAWIQHVALAKVIGVSDEQISSLQQGRVEGDHFTTKEQLMLTFVDEVMQTPRVCDATFEQMRRLFSSRELVELLLVVGLYWTVGRVMTTLDIEPDPALGLQVFELIRRSRETQQDERSSSARK